MQVGVITFPGSNCDQDAVRAVRYLGATPVSLWHRQAELGGVGAVIVPGGFSYGDYLRAGAMAAQAEVMKAVRRFADAGGPVLGTCNGFQILCEAGLLPGALGRNRSLRFECRDVFLRVEAQSVWTRLCPPGKKLRLPIAHAEGRYLMRTADEVRALLQAGRVVFRYALPSGETATEDDAEHNPNGSLFGIAGVMNAAGNVVGLMPHPERATDPLASLDGGVDGQLILSSVVAEPAQLEVRA